MRHRTAAILALALSFPLAAAAQDVRPANVELLQKMIKPQPGEWKWAQIPWMTDLAEARKKAAAEDKPLFVWTMAGEPLGQC